MTSKEITDREASTATKAKVATKAKTQGGAKAQPEPLLPGARSPRGSDRVVPRGRHGRPREEVEAIQRSRILDAFVEEVGDAGITGARVADICSAAGVSTKEFYAVFKSKNECFLAAFDLGIDIVLQRGAVAFKKTQGPWEDKLRAALSAMLTLLGGNPAFSRLCLVEVGYAAGGPERLKRLTLRCKELFGSRQPPVPPLGRPDRAYENCLVGSVFRPMTEYVVAGTGRHLTNLVPVLTYALALPIVGWERAVRHLHPSFG